MTVTVGGSRGGAKMKRGVVKEGARGQIKQGLIGHKRSLGFI